MAFDVSRVSRREFLRVGLAAAAAPSLIACGDSTSPANPPRLAARPGTPTDSTQTGLMIPLGLGTARDGFYYVPDSYDPATAIPLLVLLHGAGGAASNWQSYVTRADARDMALLVIDSRGGTWDAVRGTYGPDTTFLDRSLALVFGRVRVDPRGVALAGFSDGASYGLSLGIPNGDLFHHVVGYSPGYYDGTPPTGTPRVFVSHGTSDPILDFAYTRDTIVGTLRNQELDVTFRSFPGGHTVPAEVSEVALDWWLA